MAPAFTVKELRALLHYDPETGELVRIAASAPFARQWVNDAVKLQHGRWLVVEIDVSKPEGGAL